MSCSPCTTIPSDSGGIMAPAPSMTASHVGTTAKIGGAYLPDSYAGLSSLVAAAYARQRSASTVAVCSDSVVPTLVISSAMRRSFQRLFRRSASPANLLCAGDLPFETPLLLDTAELGRGGHALAVLGQERPPVAAGVEAAEQRAHSPEHAVEDHVG